MTHKSYDLESLDSPMAMFARNIGFDTYRALRNANSLKTLTGLVGSGFLEGRIIASESKGNRSIDALRAARATPAPSRSATGSEISDYASSMAIIYYLKDNGGNPNIRSIADIKKGAPQAAAAIHQQLIQKTPLLPTSKGYWTQGPK